MFLLHVYHTVNKTDDNTKDFLIGFMMGLSQHSFVKCSQLLSEYIQEAGMKWTQ